MALESEIFGLIKAHMEGQPGDVFCSACREILNVTVSVDNWLDMVIVVDPCPRCSKPEEGE